MCKTKIFGIAIAALLLSACNGNESDAEGFTQSDTIRTTETVTEISEIVSEETSSTTFAGSETVSEAVPFEFDPENYYTLSELTENMSEEELSQITALHLIADTSPDDKTMALFQSLTELDLSADDDIDVSALKNLENLKSLQIYGGMGSEAEGLEALAEIDPLESLNIDGVGNSIVDLSIFKDMPNLKTLVYQHGIKTTLTDTNGFDPLESLIIFETSFDDIHKIGGLTDLGSLTLGNMGISDDLSWVNDMVNLKKLVFSGTSSGKYCDIDKLQNLEYLDIRPYDYDFPDGVKIETDQLIRLKNLKEFFAAKKDFSEEDINKITAALPDCNIVLYP